MGEGLFIQGRSHLPQRGWPESAGIRTQPAIREHVITCLGLKYWGDKKRNPVANTSFSQKEWPEIEDLRIINMCSFSSGRFANHNKNVCYPVT